MNLGLVIVLFSLGVILVLIGLSGLGSKNYNTQTIGGLVLIIGLGMTVFLFFTGGLQLLIDALNIPE